MFDVKLLDKIRAALSFGVSETEKFGTDYPNLAKGGWINTTIPVLVNGTKIGTAEIGMWVHTTTGASVSADVYDEVRDSGFALRAYKGNDRTFCPVDDNRSWQKIFDLTDDEVADIGDEEIEETILDEAESSDSTEYEDVFTDALRDRLSHTLRDSTYDLLCAVRALEGEDR